MHMELKDKFSNPIKTQVPERHYRVSNVDGAQHAQKEEVESNKTQIKIDLAVYNQKETNFSINMVLLSRTQPSHSYPQRVSLGN
jgi:hypothetical protein